MSAELFNKGFQMDPASSIFSPGRVNLIGEHTDYNGGYVLPTALSLGLDISLTPREDEKINVISGGYDAIAKGSLDDAANDHWSDYAKGAIIYARKNGLIDNGANIAVNSTLPHGAGLSSSAAIIVGILKICREQSGASLTDTEISVIAREVENDFIGMPCGIMDQMAVAISSPGQALKLDTDSLEFELVDIPTDHHMAVIHSGKFRRLSEGRYKERKEECDIVKDILDRNDICRANLSDLDKLSAQDDSITRRARHCITEHQRTVKAAKALAANSMVEFGELMVQSHDSMRDDFEITLPAIDALVEDAVKLGALGARMTGGGFGGCIVACIENSNLEKWKSELLSRHEEAFYVC